MPWVDDQSVLTTVGAKAIQQLLQLRVAAGAQGVVISMTHVAQQGVQRPAVLRAWVRKAFWLQHPFGLV